MSLMKMNDKLEHYECDGQMNIYDWMAEVNKIHPVKVKGLMDDAYCPKCDYCLDELKELDCEECPSCGTKIDWAPWHRAND